MAGFCCIVLVSATFVGPPAGRKVAALNRDSAAMDRTFRGFARPNPELPNDSLAMELAIYAGGSFVYSVRRAQGSDFGMEVR